MDLPAFVYYDTKIGLKFFFNSGKMFRSAFHTVTVL